MPNSIAYLLGFGIAIGIIVFCINLLFKSASIVAKILGILFLTGGLASVLSMIAGVVEGVDFVALFNWVSKCFLDLINWLTNFAGDLLSKAKSQDGGTSAATTTTIAEAAKSFIGII